MKCCPHCLFVFAKTLTLQLHPCTPVLVFLSSIFKVMALVGSCRTIITRGVSFLFLLYRVKSHSYNTVSFFCLVLVTLLCLTFTMSAFMRACFPFGREVLNCKGMAVMFCRECVHIPLHVCVTGVFPSVYKDNSL